MGTTNSFDNTPQATDDVFTVNEDTGLITLNVMANDLGGNAKTLYSIDDGTTSSNTVAPTDLLIKDSINGNSDVSAKGARISITADGKISYDLSSVAEFQKLAAGEKGEDSFIYAIRLGNGTLSWAKAVIVVIGVNDAPQIVSVGTSSTGAITELAGQTASSALGTASGRIAFADVDLTDTHTTTVADPVFKWSGGMLSTDQSALLKAAGNLALTVTDSTNSGSGSVGWSYSAKDMAFDFLGKDQTLTVTYQVSVADNHGGTVVQNVVITVTGVNDKAVISDASVTHVQEDIDVTSGTLTASGKITISDADAGEDHFNTAVVGAQDNVGSLTLKADGTYTYSVDNSKVQHLGANDSKVDVFTVTAADGTTKEVKFTVTGTNDGPVAVADTASGTENQALTIDVLANDTDADDGHVFTLVSGTAPASKGSVAVTNNQLVFTPGADFDHLKAGVTEQVTLSYTMKDEQGATSTSSVVVTVTGTNDAPVAIADIASGTENQVLTIDVLANDTDVDDGHVFTLLSGTAPTSKGSVAVTNNQLVFTPGADFDHLKAGATEQVTLNYTMKDDQGATSTSSVVVTVTGTNDAPVAVADTASGTENQVLTIDVLANDTDVDDGHVFELVSGTAPAGKGATSVVNNQLVFTPGSDFDHLKAGATEQVTLNYTMKDDQGVESTNSVVVTVTGTNDAPVAVADIAAATENQSVSIDVLANDTDADDDHVFTLVSGTAPTSKGSVAVTNNQLVFTPGSDFDHLKAGATEQVTLSYTMKDDQGVESTSSVVVTITGTNDAPVAVADIAAATENQSVSIDVLANDTDADDGHVFTLVSGTAPTSKGSVAVTNNQLVFTPGSDFDHLKAGATEQVTLNYTMKDDQGATSTSSVVVTVTGTNDGPVAVADTAAATENQSVSIDVLANDTDVDDDHVFTLVSGAAPANKGTVSVVNNQLVFTAGADFDHLKAGATEQVTLNYTMKDDQGATSTSSVVVTVTGTNDAPVAVADIAAATENQSVSIDVLANDTDVDDDHVFTLVSGAAPANKGTVSVVNNQLVFTAGADFDHLKAGATEQVTLNYTMKDDQGATSTSSVVVTVTGTNDAPVAVADTAAATENQSVSIDVLANDTDVDDDHVFTLVSGTAPTSKGTVSVVNNQLVFTAGADFDHLKAGATEQVTLNYTMKDDQGATSTSSVVVTVTGTNDAPVAVADIASGTENQALSIDVLANDTDADDDHVFTLVSGTAPTSKGSVAVTNNQLVFTPGSDFDHLKAGATEQVTLSYTMKDDQGATSTNTVVVTVTGTNDAPVAVADIASSTENQTLNIDVLANDTDADDDHVFTLVSGTAPQGKGTTSVVDNHLVFTPGVDFDHLKAGATEQVTLSYTMKDDQGVESTSSVVVIVTGTNDAPVAVADIASGTENQALSIDVLANDTDADDDHVFTLVSGTAPTSKGSVAVTNNQLVFTPGSDFDHLKAGATEQVTLSYTMKDDQGVESTSSVVVTITGTNDAPVAVADIAAATENQALSIDVLANDTDADDDHVFTLVSGTAPTSKGSVAVTNNQLVFTPGSDFDHLKAGATEQVTLSYTMKDDQGVESTSSVVVTVTGTNDAPVAVADIAAATENQSVSIDVLANDTDADDDHVFTLVSGTAPVNKGTVSVVNNQLVFTAGSDFDHLKAGATEQVTLNYTMKDDQGVESTNSVVVTVTGTNDAPVAVADIAAATENQSVSIDVLANDTDADDDHVFTLVSGTAPTSKGSVAVTNNQLVFTPGSDFDHLKAGATEQVTLSYTMKDDQGVESTSSVVVTITGTNDAPVAVADTAAATENQSVSIDVLANDTDVDDDHVFTLVSGTAPTSKGTVSVVNNQLVFTAGADFDHLKAGATEQVTLNYTMKDDQGVESTNSVVVTVTGTNDAPVAVADIAAATENQSVSIDVLANDTDADDDHVFTLVSGTAPTSKGSVAVANNQLVFTPGSDFDHLKAGATEQVTLSYTMKDDQGATSTNTVVVTVTGTNDAPVAVADIEAATENQSVSIDVLANDTDADDDHVFTLVSGTAPASKGSVAVANNQLVFTAGSDFDHLKAGATEQVTLSYTMKDDQGATSTSSVVVTVTGTNDAPVAVADIASSTENQTLNIDVLANDTDADDDHVFTLVSGTAPTSKGSVAVANNQLVFTPGSDFDHLKAGATEQVTLNYTMKDDQGATSTNTVVVTVTGTNDAPVAVADTAAATENQSVSIDVLVNDTDADDDHVFTLVSGTAPTSKGSVAVTNNQLVFTPGSDFDHLKAGATEQVTLSYTMKDDQGATSTNTVVVTVTGTNDAPVAVADTASGTENQVLTIDVLANDTDADDDHAFTLLSGTAPATKGTVSVVNNQLVFTPGADFDHLKAGATEQVTLSYTMKDDQGVESTSSVVVTVTGTNDAPVAVADIAAATENQVLTIDVLANDTDADDDHVFTLVSGTAPTSKGTVSVANNQLVFTPGADFDHLKAGATEQVTLSYTMKDDQGVESTSSVVVTVTGTNDAPVAVADIASSTENQSVSIDVLANDTDADDDHVFTLVSGTAPTSKGSVAVTNNQLVFTPGSDFDHLKAGATEQVTLSYTMKDDQGVESTSSVVVTITGTNDAPVAVADIAAATENQSVSIDVLANDTDADDDHVFTLVSGTAPTSKGSVAVANNQLVFTPGADFDHLKAGATEQVTLSYTMKDDQSVESTSSVVVTVTGTNDAPVAVADIASSTENQTLNIDVLANDTDADDDHVFTLVSGTAPTSKGTVSVANNQLVFTPGADFDHLKAGATEQVTLSYTMKDDQGVESTSSVVVTITGTNDAPVAVADIASSTENQILNIDVLANDTDADDDHVFTLVSGTAPTSKGSVAVASNQLVFTPGSDFDHLKAGATEQVTLSYTMKDDQGVESTSSVVVTVTGTNDAPVAVADIAAATENQSVSIDVLANDTDADDDHVFTLVSGTAPTSKGSVTVANNQLVFTPGADFDHLKAGATEQVTLSYTMKDDQGATSTSSVVVTVTGTNDAPVAVADIASSTENQSLNIDVLANDTDVDDDHVFTLVSGTAPTSKGSVAVANNQLVFTPGSDFDHLKAGATEQVTLNYTMKDDQGATSTSSVVVTVTGTNDAPTVAAALTAGANEDAGNLTVNLLQGAADADDGAVLTVANVTGLVAGVTVNGSTLTVDPADASFQHLAAGATQNITVSYDVVDEHGAKVTQSATITITGTNDVPTVAASGTLAYVENQAPTAINPALTVGDVDSATLSRATVSITGAFAAGQDSLGFTDQNGITGSYDASTGVLTLSGTSSVANYQAALRSVTYSNSSDNPSTAARTVSFQVDDGAATNHASNIATSSITVAAVNDAATLSSDTKNLVETNSVLTTGGTLTVNDVDSPSTFQSQSNTAGTYGTFSIGANGVWTYATTTPHNEFVSGTTYTETFQVLSADGTATSVTINIAGTDETAVAITAINADSGSSSTDFVTNDTSLTVSGSHGTLNAGEKIQVSIDGGANWTDVTSTSATTWSYTDPAIHAASFEYQARVIDASGGAGNTARQAVTIDTTADAGPAATLAVGNSLVNNTAKTSVNYTVAGLDSDAAAVVTISDGTHTSTHTYAANGAFSFDLSGFNDGAITSSMVITDIAGNTKNVTGQSTTLDTTADGGAKVAIVLNDGDSYISKAEAGAASYTISGVDSDATATVRFSDGNAAHDVVVTGLGNVTSTVNLSGLTDGPISATVSVSDTAGNLATGTSDSSVKDATSPTLTSVALQNPATATTSADTLVFRVTFSEAVSSVDAADFVVSGTTAGVSAVTAVATGVYDITVSGGDLANLNGTVGLALKSANGGATIQDAVGNALTNFAATGSTASYTVVNAAPDTTADGGAPLALAGVSSTSGANTFTTINLTVSGFDADLASATITLKDSANHTATHALSQSELATATSTGSVTVSWTGGTTLNKNDTITATIAVQDATGNQASHSGTFEKQGVLVAPAGAAGEPIQLALSNPQDHAGLVTVNVANLPSHWTLSEGSRNADGTWTVHTSDPSKLAVTSPADFAGAVPLQVNMQWTNADGTIGSAQVTDNVEVYALGSPIFALSDDDNLTASSAADLLVFAQPIAHDTIYSFDTAADKIDLIGFTGVTGFADLSIADDAGGNAVITLANGSTITVAGVHAASLGAGNFEFNVEPTTNNAGTLTISDGAIMPFGGVINNTGTIALASSGSDTKLEVLVESLTLQGGGHVTLSDCDHNLILGGAASAKLVNIDNTISGAGQIGAGQMTLDNRGIIVADGSHALSIDTGANTVANSGTLEATGTGGLVIDSALDNSGKLWANGGNVTVHGDVSGSGSAVISGAAVLELDGVANVAVSFDAGGSGSLKLGDADHFSGSIAGFGGNDSLRLADIAVKAGSTLSFVADASGGTLTVGDGTSTAHLALLGSYANAGFVASADQGGMLLTANVADANQDLHGTDGIDLLASGAGNDVLAGGAGNDVLFGGGGSDTFVFDTAPNGAANVDTILDFQANGDADYILLSQKVFGSLTGTGGTLDAWQFAALSDGTGASALLDAGVHLIYDSQTGSLYYDADGANTVEGRTVLAVIGTFEHPSGANITHDVFKFG